MKISNDEDDKFLIFATKYGLIKRTSISEFVNIRSNGDGDSLISVSKTNGDSDILMASSNGRLVRFHESSIRTLGRTASGVRGINLGDGILVRMEVVKSRESQVLVITERGYGKRTLIDEYRITNRGGKGVKTLNITDKNGSIVSFEVLNDLNKDVMIVTDEGIIIRIDVEQIPLLSRVTQGVRLIHLKGEQSVSSVALVEKNENDYNSVDNSNLDETAINEANA